MQFMVSRRLVRLDRTAKKKNVRLLQLHIYPRTTSFRPPKKYFVLFYLLSSPVVLVIALYYLSVQEQQICSYKVLSFLL